VHRWLQVIAEQRVAAFDEARLRALAPRFQRELERLGTAPAEIERATERVVTALCRAIGDDRGRWILSDEHSQASCEFALVVAEGRRFRHLVIDRTFITAEGTRWVIDYKTSTHEGGDLEGFLASESARHAAQLDGYRAALAALGPEPVRAALYYPLLAVFREAGTPAAG
jgi:ATP-dependent exoDNAse (exonuclease V) beta subunit